ncbi:type II secretion system F family protein [Inquilinus sp. OTU3971]|uniref:type II secretion system F family protein n=1 Tax=Inquilinus sp. OTU3971 TaxID=3043855 RepID=UPI00313BA6B4
MFSPALTTIAIAALTALASGGLVVALFYRRLAPRSAFETRLEALIGTPAAVDEQANQADDARRKKAVEATLRELEEKQKVRRGGKPTLVQRIRRAGLGWSKATYFAICAAVGAGAFLVMLLGLGLGLYPSLGFGLSCGLLLPHLFVGSRGARRRKRFASEFPNAVDVIVRGVKAGLPLGDCIRIIAAEAQEPVRGEFKAIVEDQTLGVPVDQAVDRFARRIPTPEANFFAIVVAIQSRTGGSLSEALGNLAKVLRDRKKMQAKIRAVSSEAKASAAIISALPVIVALLVYITTPAYISLLFTTFIGKAVLAACAVWMGLGVLVIRKMVNFDY